MDPLIAEIDAKPVEQRTDVEKILWSNDVVRRAIRDLGYERVLQLKRAFIGMALESRGLSS